jgi:hypothetical protein
MTFFPCKKKVYVSRKFLNLGTRENLQNVDLVWFDGSLVLLNVFFVSNVRRGLLNSRKTSYGHLSVTLFHCCIQPGFASQVFMENDPPPFEVR